ncbi:MAG: GAF domain-containing protein [Chloroflexaceae bacterium]|jgi:signal transduction histidine kinase/PAS domain-containing protein|nr:GAF domain-containing protein [Chloroflexaceae bacterium]
METETTPADTTIVSLMSSGEEAFALLDMLLHHAPFGVAFLDMQGRYRLVNAWMAAMNQTPVETHLGRTVRECFPTLALQHDLAFQTVVQQGKPLTDIDAVSAFLVRQGQRQPIIYYDLPPELTNPVQPPPESLMSHERRYWNLSYYPIKQPTGHMLGVGLILRDVTPQRRAARCDRFLAELSTTVGEALDVDTTLARLVDLTVPRLADYCAVFLMDSPTSGVHRAWKTSNPAQEALFHTLHDLTNATLHDGVDLIPQVVQRGAPLLLSDLNPEFFAGLPISARTRALLQQAQLHSLLMLPITLRGNRVGVLMLITHESGRCYSEADLPLATELARRCSLALENAWLYEQTQHTLQQQQQTLALLDGLMHNAPVGITFFDRDLRYLMISDDLAAMNGHAAAEHSGRTVQEMAPYAAPLVLPAMREVLASGEPRTVALSHATPAHPKEIDHWLVTFYPLRHADGTIFGVGGVRVDISELRRTEAERSYLLAVSEFAREAAEKAAHRTARLQALTASFAQAVTPAQIGAVVVQECIQALEADAAGVLLLTDDGSAFELLAGVGFSTEDEAPWRYFPAADDLPVTRVVRSRKPIFVETLADWYAHYPRVASLHDRYGLQANAIIPLVGEFGAIGALGFNFKEPRRFSSDERAMMLALAQQCSQALERARLYQAERAARAIAESVQQWQHFLAEASTLLASSLDVEQSIGQVLAMAVPRFADMCLFCVPEHDGSIRVVADAYGDEQVAARVRMLLRDFPLRQSDPLGIPYVLHEGQPVFCANVEREVRTDERLSQLHRQALATLAMTSHLSVPVMVGAEVLGALSWALVQGQRHFTSNDMQLATELARRLGIALDNARRYAAEQRARAEAEAAVQIRDTFLSIAAHELRTPITGLLGQAQLLQRRLARDPHADERNQRATQLLVQQALRLSNMVSALLDTSRIEEGHLSLDCSLVDLNTLVWRMCEETRPLLVDHMVTYECPAEVLQVWSDELRLEQVLQNLLSNAIKYSPHGGLIHVQLSRVGSNARLCVSDAGIGVPEGEQERLFERFYRASNADVRNISGIGIGLFMVKEIVEQHGGSVSVEDNPGGGSIFCVELPLAEPDEEG